MHFFLFDNLQAAATETEVTAITSKFALNGNPKQTTANFQSINSL
jgi:hypothetical protein